MSGNWSRRAEPGHGRPSGGARWSGRVRAASAAVAVLAAVAAVVIILVQPGRTARPVAGRGSATPPGSQGPSSPSASSGASPSTSPSSHPGRSRTPSSSPSPFGPPPPPVPASSLAPARGALFGAWAEPIGGDNSAAYESAVIRLEHEIGRNLAIDQLYVPWFHQMPLAVANWDLSHGMVPMISWAGYYTSQIVSGRYDALIRATARRLRSVHGPVMLRWFAEMDGGQYRYLVSSPGSFVRAWRHVYSIFARAGATNVRWVWCPNAGSFSDGIAQRYYPGGRYVSWICGDGYNWAPKRPGAVWASVAAIFSSFYHWGLRTGKPLMIGEFGVLERRPGEKAAWFRQTDWQLRTMFPGIRAVVYFNSDHHGYDWRVTTSQSALAGFRVFADDPYFLARPRL